MSELKHASKSTSDSTNRWSRPIEKNELPNRAFLRIDTSSTCGSATARDQNPHSASAPPVAQTSELQTPIDELKSMMAQMAQAKDVDPNAPKVAALQAQLDATNRQLADVKAAQVADAGNIITLQAPPPVSVSLPNGKPAIATGYSGNVDFMNERNSYLVDYEIGRVGPECEIYPPEGEWAEPSIEHAAELMRRVHREREEASRKGGRAQADIAELLSPGATGERMRRRLEEELSEDAEFKRLLEEVVQPRLHPASAATTLLERGVDAKQ